jgi:O-antigen ligase
VNRSERLALLVLQIGAVAVVLAASTHGGFDLDRFLIPKELVLHAAAALAGFFALDGIRRGTLTRVDLLLIIYLLLSAVAAVFATNHWLAGRALAISVSSVLLFWIARSLGNPRPLVNVLAIAVMVVAITSLLQAYGIWIDLFSQNRAPGGTLGNRNFIAHAAAFGMPVVLLAALQGRWFASIGVTVVTASLVLTRSRAAWLAFAAAALVFAIAIVLSRALRNDGRTWRRLAVVLLLVGGGVAAALLIPNTLNWRSDNPYLESVQGVVNYQDGSGRGRLIQYERSLRMAGRHPLFGVGPGNWAVEYPEHAPASDPSIDTSDSGMTINPWPSSDWVAFASERGFMAAFVLAIALVMLAWSSLKRLVQTADVDEALMSTALIATMAGACVAGAFDAVLLLALPSFLVWATLGALASRADVVEVPSRALFLAGVTLAVFALLASARSATQLAAMELFTRGDRPSLRRAARVDPGNYRVHMRLARAGGRGRCEHAVAAKALYPHAEGSRSASRGCLGVRGR